MMHKTSKFLLKAGQKNADLIMAGLCFAFAVAATPALTNLERGNSWMKPWYGSYDNAQEIYSDARQETLERLEALVSVDDYKSLSELDANELNRYLYEQRNENNDMRALSDFHWENLTPLRHAQKTRNMNKNFGNAFAVTFALLGGGFMIGAATRIRQRKKAPKLPPKPM